jgi:flagellar P-ring protein FlgI
MGFGFKQALFALLVAAVFARGGQEARATTVQDLARVKGMEENVFTGLGIVVGLDGTGDKGKDSLVAARPYGELLKNLGNSVQSLSELDKADTFAIVMVTLRVPAAGGREGDKFDVRLNCLFNAKSLAGGTLVPSMVRLPLPDSAELTPIAMADGLITVDPANPRSATVKRGASLLQDIRPNPVTPEGHVWLVLNDEYAVFSVADVVAGIINDEFALSGYSGVAYVEDVKSIRVTLPEADRRDPSSFLATLTTLYVDPSLLRIPARVVINEREGLIIATASVEIGPVAITHNGLSITTITPEPTPSAENPQVNRVRWAGLDTTDRSGRNRTKLQELLAALRQLDVPVKDQIAILYELRKSGALHAEIVTQ